MRMARTASNGPCFRAKREPLKRFHGLLPESHGQNLAVTVLHVPCSFGLGLIVKNRKGGGEADLEGVMEQRSMQDLGLRVEG